MSWRQGRLQEADRQLLERAGVATEGRIIVQFFPPELENTLAMLEQRFAGRDAAQIRKTIFGLRRPAPATSST